METSSIEGDAAANGRSTSRRRTPVVMRFVGALDAGTVPAALQEIDDVVVAGARGVVVDLAELELLDSSGVRALLALRRRVTEQGGSVVIVNASGQPLLVLARLELGPTFGLPTGG